MKHTTLITAVLITASGLSHAVEKDEMLANAYSWSGIYAGLNAGLLNHTMRITDNQATAFYATIEQESNAKLTGGLQLGYRHASTPAPVSAVYGIELSANFSAAKFNQEYGSPFALYQIASESELNNYFLLEAVGGIAVDRTLLFLAAGLSLTNTSGGITNLDDVPFFHSFNTGATKVGTAVGAGIEYAYNERISLRFKTDLITPNSYTAANDLRDTYRITNQIIQGTFGINYRFG